MWKVNTSSVVWHIFSTHCTAVKSNAVITYVLQHHHHLPSGFLLPFFFFPQLEDDIVAKPDYIQSIKNFAAKQSQEWMILEFSQLGFIGKY